MHARTHGCTENIYSIFRDKLLLLGEHVWPTSRTVCRKKVWCKNVKNVTLRTQRVQGESAQYLSNRLAKATLFRGDKPRGASPRRHLCTFRILIPYYFVPYIMPLCHSAIPPFHHSAITPFRHSAIPPFRHSAIPPFRHSAIPPFHHSAILLQYAITQCMYHRRS